MNSRALSLGILGGGQLGRMLVHAAQRMGLCTVVLDPDSEGGAAQASNAAIAAGYGDATALDELAKRCAQVTTEFENVPAASLQRLADAGVAISPPVRAVQIAQDRREEKRFFAECAAQHGGPGPVAYAVIESAADVQTAPEACFPGILKTAQLGYDGKGQVRVANRAELAAAFAALKGVPCVLEQRVDLAWECSVVLARGRDGDIVTLPLHINAHRGGILHTTHVGMLPEGLDSDFRADFEGFYTSPMVKSALDTAKTVASTLSYVGTLCIEFFVLKDGSLRVNEMAPRPHNSGHHSIDSCSVSQFELQARAAIGWPLVQPRLHSPCVMLNLLGDVWFDASGRQREPNWPAVLALPGAHLHLYGKTDARRARKMGHLAITGATAAEVQTTLAQAQSILGIAP
jgi:5-(carboxyamino)imidazole ribonucleotide synthase